MVFHVVLHASRYFNIRKFGMFSNVVLGISFENEKLAALIGNSRGAETVQGGRTFNFHSVT